LILLVSTRRKFNRDETIEWLISHSKETDNGCLELETGFWNNYNENGYPIISWNGRKISMCRFICFEPDEWKSDLVTRHKCHRKTCINPDHLIKGTHLENKRDNYYEPFMMPEHHDWWDDENLPEREYEDNLKERMGISEDDYSEESFA